MSAFTGKHPAKKPPRPLSPSSSISSLFSISLFFFLSSAFLSAAFLFPRRAPAAPPAGTSPRPLPNAMIPPRTTPAHSAQMRAIWNANRWGLKDETLFREYVEPQTTLGERCVDWLPVLKPLAEKMAQGAKTPFEAAALINRKISRAAGVVYSTKRDLPNQDPLHSMRIGLASCSGLSILLVDACRSLGIPARIVGCFWRKKPGNHSWVEVWSGGGWHVFGAFEDVPPDKVWFLADAADADPDDPRYMIYAARATPAPGGLLFRNWNVPADNVTARYARKPGP